MNWVEVLVKTKPENEDIVTDILYTIGANGLTIEDKRDIDALKRNSSDWDFIEEDVINTDYDGVILKAYFSQEEDINNILDKVRTRIQDTNLGEIMTKEIDESDWAENWKQHYKTSRLGTSLIIKPSWEDYEPLSGDVIIQLDPGMAFGTGTHETTMMCAEALEKYIKPDTSVFDIGCGSGILSIIAAKLGAKYTMGTDLDPMCIKVSKENAIINKVENKVEFLQGNLLDMTDKKADIIVANIIAEVIVYLIPSLKNHLNEEGIFISSGIIEEKIPLVENSLRDNGFTIIEVNKKNGWAAIVSK